MIVLSCLWVGMIYIIPFVEYMKNDTQKNQQKNQQKKTPQKKHLNKKKQPQKKPI